MIQTLHSYSFTCLVEMTFFLPHPLGKFSHAVIPLRQKLLAIFLPIGLLPITVAGGLSGYFMYQQASRQAELRLNNLATMTAGLTAKDLEGKMALLSMLATNPLVLEAVQVGARQAETSNLQNLPIETVETKFAQTKLVSLNPSINGYLRTVAISGGFAEIFFTERNGFNVAASRMTSDFVQRDEAWWQHGKQQRQWIGAPKFDQSTQRVTIEIIMAIHDPNSQKFAGVLKGGYDAINLEYLKKELLNLQLTGSEQLQILALGDQIMALATVDAAGVRSSQEILGQEAVRQYESQLQRTLRQDFSQLQTVFWSDGDRQYMLATIPRTRWVAVASMTVAQIQASGYQLASLLSLVFLGLGVVTTGVILRFSRALSAPLNNLAHVAQQATENADFTMQAAISTQNDEVGVLATSFNQLLQRVQQLLHEQAEAERRLKIANQTLEQKVHERTQELEVYSQTLEQKVYDRTQELQEKARCLERTLQQLQQAQAQMVQAEKMSSLGQLVAGIAHEINNPVNFIHGNIAHAIAYVQDLLELLTLYQVEYPTGSPQLAAKMVEIELDFLQEDLPNLLNSMTVGTNRIREIVQSLRIFSRLDESEIKAVDIHQGIDSTLMILDHRLKPTCDRARIEVIKDYGQIPAVECYGGQLNQVFMNILTNAIDALEDLNPLDRQATSQPHRGRITIRTSVINQWLEIAIADNGPGIPSAVQQRIFDPFFTTKPVGKGTGMGMAISYQIVTEKHHGKLECLSTPGSGTEFVIQIPLVRDLVKAQD